MDNPIQLSAGDSVEEPSNATNTYVYHPLDKVQREIRLLHLLPGEYDDPLQIKIVHEPFFEVLKPQIMQRLSLKELQETLPENWKAYETLEGRYIFADKTSGNTTWTHPKPDFEKHLYDPPEVLDPYPDFNPRYEALSYTWGDDAATQIVEVTDTRRSSSAFHSSELYVRPNLHVALKHLRDLKSERILWIDALCINQEDEEEKNDQVKRMGDIFRLAYRVVVWLGDSTPDGSSGRAVDILRYLGDQIEATKGLVDLRSPGAREPLWYNFTIPLQYDECDLHAIRQLLERPWFDRLWIFQEICLANHRAVVQCGRDYISWCSLRRAIMNLNVRKEVKAVIPRALSELRKELAFSQSRLDLSVALLITASAKCSIIHDRIFSILGLLHPAVVELIRADYTLPIEEIFQDVCLARMETTGLIDFLGHCEGVEHSLPSGPSWVPNWLKRNSASYFQFSFVTSRSGSRRSRLLDRHTLQVHGIECGKLQDVASPAPRDGNLRQTFLQWQEIVIEKNERGMDDSLEDIFLRTLCCGEVKERWVFETVETLDEHRVAYHSYISNSNDLKEEEENHFTQQVWNCVRGRRFFQSGNLMGLCPSTARENDILCVILGFTKALILRPTGSETYQVVGPAYVHGLSDGQAVLGPLPDEWQVLYDYVPEGFNVQIFHNKTNDHIVYDDPRLGPLPDGWEYEMDHYPTKYVTKNFRDQTTGKVTTEDPRWTPEALINRGVPIRTFNLV